MALRTPVPEYEFPSARGWHAAWPRGPTCPPPRLCVVEVPEPNAFLVGGPGQRPAVVVTRGLLEAFDHDEIKGVIAHELAHSKLGKTSWSTYAAALLSLAVLLFAQMGGLDDSLQREDTLGGDDVHVFHRKIRAGGAH